MEKNEKQKSGLSKKICIVLIVTVVLFACSKSVETTSKNDNSNNGSVDCSSVLRSFSVDVNPIIQTKCATGSSCHGTGSINGPGALLTYSAIANAHTDIRSAVLSGLMPKNGTLTTAQKNAIICWIDNGALNN